MFRSRKKNNDFRVNEFFEQSKGIVVFWAGVPYDSEILFISRPIEGLNYSKQDYINNPALLKTIRSLYDESQLDQRIEYILNNKEKSIDEIALTFCIKGDNNEEIWIKEATRFYIKKDGSFFGETYFENISDKMDIAFFIKDAAKETETNYNVSKLRPEDIEKLGAVSVQNLQMFLELHSSSIKDKMAFGTFMDHKNKQACEFKGSNHIIDYCNNIVGEEEINRLVKDATKEATTKKEKVSLLHEKSGIKCLAMPLYYKEVLFCTWIVIYSEKYTDNEDEFVLDMETTKKNMNSYLQVYAESILVKDRKDYLENNLVEEINKNDVFHYIINLMESDKDLSSIAKGLLVEMGNAMHLTNAFVLQIPNDRRSGDFNVIGEWTTKDHKSYVEYYREFIKGIINEPGLIQKEFDNVIIVSEESTDSIFKPFAVRYNVGALIIVPIFSNITELTMCAVFIDDTPGRNWEVSDISFASNICSVLENILFKRSSKEQLQSSYGALRGILDNMGSMIYVSDKETEKILFCNSVVKSTLKIDVNNKSCKDIPEIAAFNAGENEIRDKESGNWYEIKRNDITWIDGNVVNLWVVSDITRKKNYEERIERSVKFDLLTGLRNRVSGEKDLEDVIMDCRLDESKNAALLFIDLDNFKDINDGLGHKYGDGLLRMVAQGMRSIDGVGDKCYRFGGDEFIIIVTPENHSKLNKIIDSLITLFNKPWAIEDETETFDEVSEYYCTMSMGVVRINKDSTNANDVIKNADVAMYESKKSGKNGFTMYRDLAPNEISKRLEMEKTMRNAISQNCEEFKVYLQPIVDSETGMLSSCESLVRWDSAEKGFIMPGDFIELAEHIGTIYDIGEHILRKACIINKQWEDEGYTIRTNVNVSMMQIMQSNVVEKIEEILNETNVNRDNIILEITENIAASDIERTAEIIDRIRKLGLKIALDDFGTGYSSLSYIKKLKPDIIKVDRVFIKDIHSDPYAETFIKMIVEIAKVLNTKICVEGVETIEQYITLKEMGATYMQGFLFGKAVEPQFFKQEFLEEKKLDNIDSKFL